MIQLSLFFKAKTETDIRAFIGQRGGTAPRERRNIGRGA